MKPEQRQQEEELQQEAKAGSTWRRGKHTESGSHVVNKCGSGAHPPPLRPSIHPSTLQVPLESKIMRSRR